MNSLNSEDSVTDRAFNRPPLSRPLIAGVIPVFQTPYHDDESIDLRTLEREIDWLFASGADGIAMAMVSELLRLSSVERLELAAAACHLARGRGGVIVSVGAESSRLAEQFAVHAAQCGAAAVMAIPPVTTALDEPQLYDYFVRILRAVEIPVVVQDASGYVGRPIPLGCCQRLWDQFGERVYFKPEAHPIGPRLSALRQLTGGQARVFEGSGGLSLVDSYRRGIVGTIPGAELIRAIVALWQALQQGDEVRIYRLSLPIGALVALQTSLDAFLAIEKYLLVQQGVFTSARVRGPVGYVLDDETRREVDRLYALVEEALP
jgi:4-hydroxy-tetrahydrodipicolinate synthase